MQIKCIANVFCACAWQFMSFPINLTQKKCTVSFLSLADNNNKNHTHFSFPLLTLTFRFKQPTFLAEDTRKHDFGEKNPVLILFNRAINFR